mmetsp:Transcript_16937/g.39378  ORF Transcript_16937/g.39378 Transcript_16937/m.39378 type:complete len:232 (+) Transcript_16937:2075-2770(+)
MADVVTLDAHIYSVVLPLVALAIDVFVPVDVTVVEAGTRHVYVAVAVNVQRSHREDEVCVVVYQSLLKVPFSVVPPKAHVIVAVARHDQVLVAVEIYVGCNQTICAGGLRPVADHILNGRVEVAANSMSGARRVIDNVPHRVGVPCNGIVVLRGGGQVEQAVAVEIGGDDRPCSLSIAVHDLLDLTERALVYILKDGYCVIARRRGDDIRVAVVVEVGHGHALPLVHRVTY